MLAYVFWHWPAAEVAHEAYEQLLLSFHRALAEAAIPGFQSTTTFRVEGHAPWLGGTPAYADWYLLDGSSALDVLNEAAVSSTRKGPHDVLARAMAAGAGSLLQLRSSEAHLEAARVSSWVAKPKGMPYDPFYARLQPVCASHKASLWRRQMVLGPTTEFGLLSPTPIPLPQGVDGLQLRLEPLAS
jgi:hypothetical protein